MNPTVSVVIASYNFGQYVGTALKSVLAQTRQDFEIIVVDDGSTDDSLAVIGRFLEDDRIRLLRQRHCGQARAKNRGIEAATGRFIAFLDADDYWLPQKLERQLPRFHNPSVGVVFARRQLIDTDGQAFELPSLTGAPPPRGDVLNELFRQNFICFSSAIVRADVVAHVGLFDERLDLGIDYDYWLRVARHYRFDFVDEVLAAYRVGHANLSRRQLERLHSALAIMGRFRRHYGGDADLDRRAIAHAEAETMYHLSVISRGFSRPTAIGWALRALMVHPLYGPAWSGLISAIVPTPVRRLARWIRGRDGSWEQHCFTATNRPETIL